MNDPLDVPKSFVPSFDYDLFVSYAHDDNTLPDGTLAEFGWITALARNLNAGPNHIKKRIFIDHQLRVGDDFDARLTEKVQRSAALIIVLSRKYVESSWCGKELDLFVRARTDDPKDPGNVFVVELMPYERLEQAAEIHENIRRVRQRRLFASFWYWVQSAGFTRVAGSPSPMEDKDGAAHYWQQLDALRTALDERLLGLRRSHTTSTRAAPESSSSSPILLADCTEDLDERRQQLRISLQAEGVPVLPETDYSAILGTEVERNIERHVQACQLFVQLLSPVAGKARGASSPLPHLQYELARRQGLTMMQWCDASIDPEAIADTRHRMLFRSGFLHQNNFERFKEEVLLKYRTLVREADRASAPQAVEPLAGRKKVFLDDVFSGTELSREIRALLLRNGCEVRAPDPQDSDDDVVLTDLLRTCRAGISIYPDRTHRAGVKHRLLRYLDLIAEKQLGVLRWGIYFASDSGDIYSDFRVASDDLLPIPGARGVAQAEPALVGFLAAIPT